MIKLIERSMTCADVLNYHDPENCNHLNAVICDVLKCIYCGRETGIALDKIKGFYCVEV